MRRADINLLRIQYIPTMTCMYTSSCNKEKDEKQCNLGVGAMRRAELRM
jgi:hypothetical protein